MILKFFTTRYTAELEKQIGKLEAEKRELREDNCRLTELLAGLLQQPPAKLAAPVPIKREASKGQRISTPRNWLDTRDQLEVSSDTRHHRYEPTPEKED